MKDMLVRLMDLPDVSELESKLLNEGVIFRRPIPPEKSFVKDWVHVNFGTYWANEVDAAFSHLPVHCFIGQKGNEILGFACYEATAKNFFGPTGTAENLRGKGIGKILLIKSLQALKEMGYAYAIIGGVGPAEFYKHTVDAVLIEKSENSIYQNLIRKEQ
ncbi:GNAT family N-acetyltransferase [Cecembia calidifontis]|uniref:Acetyltransferase (GNAT) family protein n=1 Tax=Cecembia calidifontis TaxID=1187080 RepID=A0A4Q7P9E3_9BACT|nr:GNAT family N-acetyltransferase [Cecembia calidifontis]RZS96833.1 acetyltransferase (GNAT) family protein [Cecembia calidifontis]